MLFFYGAIAVWITRNREALEREPPPLDFVGRLIITNGASKFEAEPESRNPPPSVKETVLDLAR
jgi:hypothetical protein